MTEYSTGEHGNSSISVHIVPRLASRKLMPVTLRSRPVKWCRRAGSQNARLSARGVHPLVMHAP